jgi:hypothetical protein
VNADPEWYRKVEFSDMEIMICKGCWKKNAKQYSLFYFPQKCIGRAKKKSLNMIVADKTFFGLEVNSVSMEVNLYNLRIYGGNKDIWQPYKVQSLKISTDYSIVFFGESLYKQPIYPF